MDFIIHVGGRVVAARIIVGCCVVAARTVADRAVWVVRQSRCGGCVGRCSSSRGSPRSWRCADSGEVGCRRRKPTRARLLERPVLDPCKPGFCLQQRCGAGKHAVRALDVAVDHVEHALGRAVKDDLILEDGHPKHLAVEVVARHVQVEVDRRVVNGKMLHHVEQDLDLCHGRRRHTASDQTVDILFQLGVRLTHRLGDHVDHQSGHQHQRWCGATQPPLAGR